MALSCWVQKLRSVLFDHVYERLSRSVDFWNDTEAESDLIHLEFLINKLENVCEKADQDAQKSQSNLRSTIQRCDHLRDALEHCTKTQKQMQEESELAKIKVQNATMAGIRAEEKFRRQTEMMEDLTTRLNEVERENKTLILQQIKLQKWTEPQSDDDELGRYMNSLYDELEQWINHHFSREITKDIDKFCYIFGTISYHIYETYLLKGFIGLGIGYNSQEGLLASQIIDHVSKTVQDTCPPYVRQHYFSASSRAAFSINIEALNYSCDQLVDYFESRYGYLSPTNGQKRNGELRSLIWKFVEFKARLERQSDRYIIEQVPEDAPFNKEIMISITGTGESDPSESTVVKYAISQVLYKISADGGYNPVARARVKTRSLKAFGLNDVDEVVDDSVTRQANLDSKQAMT